MKIVVALPAYNEEECIATLIERVGAVARESQLDLEVLVIDDASTDSTVSAAEACNGPVPVRVVRRAKNLGLGAGLRDALEFAGKELSDDDVLITMDADNTHSPELIPQMVEAIRAGADIVIASRYAPGGAEVGLKPHRKVLSRGASSFLKAFFPLSGARDCSCGYRAYRPEFLRRAMAIYGDRLVENTSFVCMAEALVKMALIGARIVEVPLVLRYDLKAGASKMSFARTIRDYGRLACRRRELARFAAAASGRGGP
jgi:dolichol-phosphate mannosyltransferase